ncbi:MULTISPECIES: hypothetical protein [Pseudonocardia]|uniref:Uncharacterized protein n=2 Tax=Pseudonocardia TaxID=1847 RepID=A0A1Y2MSC4_PSEAH|nr:MULTISPECIES: hypothetical protein [Pseudonocardia]OSY38124.1 hypothetical protein BG845_04297 [Pseudonocardia autotrophica]TDN75565.1 hypothetical protein C8E95_4742 [Pseudonocardia autotrophica]BBF99535.1 hypothetical protein Pdca_07450 [Pseudonocardia autotrophica]GEC27774.1 hypothetical protein PSA01_48030 [Pseudonocardia saturnea]
MSDPVRRNPLVRALTFPAGTPPPLLVMIVLSTSMVGVFSVPLLLPDATPLWVRSIVGVLVVFGLMVATALLRRAVAKGRERR